MEKGGKPIRNPFVVLREEFDDWAVLFNPDTGRGYGTNPSGVLLWRLLNGEHGLDELPGGMHGYVKDTPEDIREHIGVFVTALVAEGLAVISGPECHSTTRSNAPPVEWSAGTPFIYEAPILVNLSSGQSAVGACYNHGSQGGSCYSGAGATGCCISGTCGTNNGTCCGGSCGTTASCCSGACDGTDCAAGGNPLNYPCGYGSSNPVMCGCNSYGANATTCSNGVSVGPY